jgi:alpha-galactosidase
MTNVLVQQLAVEASLTGNTENIVHAVAMDPLTSAVCTLAEARDMASEMLEAQREWLPQFKDKKITPRPAVKIPKNVKPVDVPLDPALAIAHRFGKLAEMKAK